MITSELLHLGGILGERVIESSVPELERPVSLKWSSSDDVGALETLMLPKSECRSDMGLHVEHRVETIC